MDFGVGDVSRDGKERISCQQTKFSGHAFIIISSVTERQDTLQIGNRMKEGEDYEDAFAPVLHATSGHIIISLAAANNLELHSCHL
eukprot:387117-Rhodomonas_salina.1